MLTRWEYIVSGRSRTLEVGSAPDDQLSSFEAIDDVRLSFREDWAKHCF
jgi:hypothetical protein